MSQATAPRRIAVIGGGITGLAAAHHLRELRPDWDTILFESSDRLGGVLQTEHRDGLLIERSADMFTTRDPWAMDLCRRLGMADQLIGTNPVGRRAMVVSSGRLCAVPDGFTLMAPARVWPVLTTPILTWRGKLRLAWEFFVKARRETSDESLESFAVRRLGREAFERLIQPLISGIYTADPSRLSMEAALPQFVEMERRYGSVTRALRAAPQQQAGRQEGGARYGLFVAPRDGIGAMIEALARRLPMESVRFKTPVSGLSRNEMGQWVLRGDTPQVAAERPFDGVVLATRAYQSGMLVESVDPALGNLLRSVHYASAAVVVLVVHRDQIAKPFESFGFVVPLREQRRILAASFSNLKFAGRAPSEQRIIRVFIGGACQPELLENDDATLQRIAMEELGALIGLQGAPQFAEVVRWTDAMPQYHVGHVGVVREIELLVAKHPGLALAGNAYHGVGIPFCIRSGESAAKTLAGVASDQPSAPSVTEIDVSRSGS